MELCKSSVLHEWQLHLQVLYRQIINKILTTSIHSDSEKKDVSISWAQSCNSYTFDLNATERIPQNTGKYRSFLHDQHSPERDTTVRAFGEIFADFSSIAIARDALFEHCVRVCVKSNP